jgi:glycosyltransferase involved in cell wall biosynthesis
VNILILVPCLGYGGAERQISLIAPRLVKHGYTVVIVSMIPPRAYAEQMEAEGVKVLTLKMIQGKYSAKSIASLWKIIREYQFKYLITFNYPANFLGRLMKVLVPGIKLITSIRSTTFGSEMRERIIKLTKNLDFKTVPNSFNASSSFIKRGVINPICLNVIRNGIIIPSDKKDVDIEFTHPKFVLQEEEFLWIAVGRFDPPKDYVTLIKACSLLKAETRKWRLIILGDGNLRGEIEENIIQYGLENKVLLLGKTDNVDTFYNIANAYVSSSAWEGMPNALVEAMTARLPVVSTDVGEVSRLVGDGQGFIVKPRDYKSLAAAMTRLMNTSPTELEEMGLKSREFVENNFNIEKIIKEWVTMLE